MAKHRAYFSTVDHGHGAHRTKFYTNTPNLYTHIICHNFAANILNLQFHSLLFFSHRICSRFLSSLFSITFFSYSLGGLFFFSPIPLPFQNFYELCLLLFFSHGYTILLSCLNLIHYISFPFHFTFTY